MIDASTNSERSHVWIGILATICAFALVAKVSFFSPDSWSYLELSNSIFSNFYKTNTVRQYVVDSDYSCAFPPVWPVLIATVRLMWDIGIYAGTLINFVVCLALLAALIRLARRLDVPGWVGTAVYLGILACTAFLDDALGARNCALSLLFLTLTAQILIRCELGPLEATRAGLWMGLACMNRFDAVPAAAVCGLIIIIRAARSGFRQGLIAGTAYTAMFAIMVSPWIVYSELKFGSWWMSDNSRQVFLPRDGFVMNYYAMPPDLNWFGRPREWLTGLLTDKIPMSWKGLVYTLIHSATLPLLGVLLIVRAGTKNPVISPARRRFLLFGGMLAAAFAIAPTIVGYGDERYFLPVQWFLLIAIFTKLLAMIPGEWPRGRVIALLCVMSIATIPSDAIPWLVTNRAQWRSGKWFPAPRKATAEMEKVAHAIEQDAAGKWSRLLVYSPYGGGHFPTKTIQPNGTATDVVTHFRNDGAWNEWQYGALTGRRVAVLPRIKSGSYATYFRDWRITHIYDGLQMRSAEFRAGGFFDDEKTAVKLIPLDVPGLYRIELRPKEK